MKKNTLEKVLEVLEHGTNQVELSEEVRVEAVKPLEQMHELAK